MKKRSDHWVSGCDHNNRLTKKKSNKSSLASEISVSKLKQGSNRTSKDFAARQGRLFSTENFNRTHFVSDGGHELRRERRADTTATAVLLRCPRWVSGLLGLVPSARQTCDICVQDPPEPPLQIQIYSQSIRICPTATKPRHGI